MGAQEQEGVGGPGHGPVLPRNYIAWGSAPWGSREPGRQERGNGQGGRVWGRASRGEGCPGLNAQVGPLTSPHKGQSRENKLRKLIREQCLIY